MRTSNLRIISIKKIREFIEKHSDSQASLLSWYSLMKAGRWKNFVQLKDVFGSADVVGERTVFDIANNRYRLVARVNYKASKVFVLHILTHKDYDKGGWK